MKYTKSIPLALALTLMGSVVAPVALALQTKPLAMEPLFQLNPTSALDLETQTRIFQTHDQEAVFLASASVLQDMGYKVTGGERKFGLLMGEKTAEVMGAGTVHALGEAALVTVTVIMSMLIGEDVITDLPEQVAQRIHVNLLVSAAGDDAPNATKVRISLDRDMLYDHGGMIPDHTELPRVYQEFFDRLSKAVYLEGEQL